jgi:hypothetical protein
MTSEVRAVWGWISSEALRRYNEKHGTGYHGLWVCSDPTVHAQDFLDDIGDYTVVAPLDYDTMVANAGMR